MQNYTLGSLFDGSGGFPLAAKLRGITPIWASEIEPFPIRVTTKRFPKMRHYGDISKMNGAEIEPVDIITAGFCCQDLSVAGKRVGLHGERSGLFFQVPRIIKEMLAATKNEYPKFIILENVPGLLSSNKGEDVQLVLDALQELGFAIDINVLDAQKMGVPQRRKRVFIVGVSTNYIMQNYKLASSKVIILQWFIKILQFLLIEAYPAVKQKRGANLLNDSASNGTLQKMVGLFLLQLENDNYKKLLNSLEEMLEIGMESPEIFIKHQDAGQIEGGSLLMADMKQGRVGIEQNQQSPIGVLLKSVIDDALHQINPHFVSEMANEVIEKKIFAYATVLFAIKKHLMALLNTDTDTYQGMIKSCSDLIEECIDYANQTDRGLPEEMERPWHWNIYIQAVSDYNEQIKRHIRSRSGQKVLPQPYSVQGHPQKGREKREDIAPITRAGAKRAIFDGYNSLPPLQYPPTASVNNGSPDIKTETLNNPCGTPNMQETFRDVVGTLRAGAGAPKHESDWEKLVVCRSVPYSEEHPPDTGVSYGIQGSMIGRDDKNGPRGDGVNKDVCFTLNTTDRHAVAYGICSYASNSMKSSNPHSGIYIAESSRTIDVGGGNPACNQGGILIVEPALYCEEGIKDVLLFEPRSQDGVPRIHGDISPTINTAQGGQRQPCVALFAQSSFGGYSEGAGTLRNSGGDYGGGSESLVVVQSPASLFDNVETSNDFVTEGVSFDGEGKEIPPFECLAPCCNLEHPKAINRPEYITRRLTPTECARLQGFPDYWCSDLGTENPSEEELAFFTEVFETHRRIMGVSKKPKSQKQIEKWLKSPHSDSAEYKMWGNGVALPCVLFILENILAFTLVSDAQK